MNIQKTLYQELRASRPEAFATAPVTGIRIVTEPDEIAAAETAGTAHLDPRSPSEWRETGVLYHDAFCTFVKDPVQFPDGRYGTYIRIVPPLSRPNGVAVLPIVDGDYVFIQQFRHATRRFHWEAPRGYGELGQSAAVTAAQELREELSAQVLDVVPLGEIYPDTGYIGSPLTMFAAKIASFGTVDAGDGIAGIRRASRDQTRAAIVSGELNDCITVALIARYEAGLVA